MSLYVALVVKINEGNAESTPYSLIIWLLEIFFIPIMIVEKVFPKINQYSFASIIIGIGVFASLISVFMLLNPSITNFVLGSVIVKPYDNAFDYWLRCFGIAEGLTNSYGIIQGVLGSLCLILGNRRKWYYYLFLILFALSAIINARTGIIALIITICFKFVYSSIKTKVSFVTISIVLYFLFIFVINKYAEDFVATLEHVSNFFTSTSDYIFKGEKNDYYGALDTFIQFPDTFVGFIFGEGITLFGAYNRASSDISYINQIFTGGLIFLIGLLAIQIFIYRKLLKLYPDKFFVCLLFLTALIINFKGVGFCISESYSRFVMLLYAVLIHNKYFTNKIVLY